MKTSKKGILKMIILVGAVLCFIAGMIWLVN